MDIDGKCRLCGEKDETVQHITSGCSILAHNLYIHRHNNIVKYIYWVLMQKHNFNINREWWKNELKNIIENSEAKILWETTIQTDTIIPHNRPDIVYTDKITKHTYLIDISVPSDYNIRNKEIEKCIKYEPLKREMIRLYKYNISIIPIIVGCTGVVTYNLKRYCEEISNNIKIDIMQKQAALNTSRIISRFLSNSVTTHQHPQLENEAPLN